MIDKRDPDAVMATSDSEPKSLPVYLRNNLFETMLSNGATFINSVLQDGTDINFQDEEGMTPLHHAAALGARPCIRLLVNSGKCDYLLQDNLGRYASDLAIEWARDYAVGRLLTKHQVRQAYEQGVPAWSKAKIKELAAP
ncbi:MAG: ankyrin repeat domain-containing protein [Telluria sp.]